MVGNDLINANLYFALLLTVTSLSSLPMCKVLNNISSTKQTLPTSPKKSTTLKE